MFRGDGIVAAAEEARYAALGFMKTDERVDAERVKKMPQS